MRVNITKVDAPSAKRLTQYGRKTQSPSLPCCRMRLRPGAIKQKGRQLLPAHPVRTWDTCTVRSIFAFPLKAFRKILNSWNCLIMSGSIVPPAAERFFSAGSLTRVQQERMLTVPGLHCPVLICWHDGEVFALDNRCPHMGFPLSKGTLKDGVLTCHWHHAQFDLRSGCTFDLWADDAPAYEVKVVGGEVWVSQEPKRHQDRALYVSRLRRGLEQNIGLIQVKSMIPLLADGAEQVIREIAHFGAWHHRSWRDGMTMLAVVARLRPYLSETTLVYALAAAARSVAENCAGEPTRHDLDGLEGEGFDEHQLSRWMFHWTNIRHSQGAERTLLTAVNSGFAKEALNRLVFGPVQVRVYADGGHALDLSNKAFELLDIIGWENAREILPLVVEHLTDSRSEEEGGSWRSPIDLIDLIEEAGAKLANYSPKVASAVQMSPKFFREFLGEDPRLILELLVDLLDEGAAPIEIARHLTLAAAWRLASFPESNDIDDWFAPMHTFSFCNALTQVLGRGEPGPEIVKGLLHGAMSVYIDRFLNIPAAKLAGDQMLEDLPEHADELRKSMLESLDERKGWSVLPRLVVRYLRLGSSEPDLIDFLTFATTREDLDFHKMQVLEAAVTQAQQWPGNQVARELLYTAAARHLAAHCPTRRGASQSVAVALRLNRGEEIAVSS
jgi:nitrite reductase/ring-hydroxylating ferredoxin subunit